MAQHKSYLFKVGSFLNHKDSEPHIFLFARWSHHVLIEESQGQTRSWQDLEESCNLPSIFAPHHSKCPQAIGQVLRNHLKNLASDLGKESWHDLPDAGRQIF